MHAVLRILLVVSLLGAQFVLAEHEVDLAAHADGHVCEVCLHGKPLGHGLQFAVPAAVVVGDCAPALPPLAAGQAARPAAPKARAPPYSA